jgi:hypothetical protein
LPIYRNLKGYLTKIIAEFAQKELVEIKSSTIKILDQVGLEKEAKL